MALQISEYKEWQQIYVLLGEARESAQQIIFTKPYPHFAGAIASSSLLVLADPLHFMYTKINKFLNKSPQWNTAKLPSYWIDRILLHPPIDNDAHYREVEWMLETLTNGLRDAAVRSSA